MSFFHRIAVADEAECEALAQAPGLLQLLGSRVWGAICGPCRQPPQEPTAAEWRAAELFLQVQLARHEDMNCLVIIYALCSSCALPVLGTEKRRNN